MIYTYICTHTHIYSLRIFASFFPCCLWVLIYHLTLQLWVYQRQYSERKLWNRLSLQSDLQMKGENYRSMKKIVAGLGSQAISSLLEINPGTFYIFLSSLKEEGFLYSFLFLYSQYIISIHWYFLQHILFSFRSGFGNNRTAKHKTK